MAAGGMPAPRVHAHEPEILGTAGALKNAESLLRGAPFLVVNADVLAGMDLQALWTRHRERGALVTMVVRPDPAAHDARPVVIDEHDRVRQINGRPEALDAGIPGEEGTKRFSPAFRSSIRKCSTPSPPTIS